MNSIVKVFSNFRDFYNEINGATLTGAIDVIVVEQPDGEFKCSPFHVRFGKLGVLRSREKVVDIEINGEPVDIHMKLGESGEAFFVEECAEDDADDLPQNLATSPIPINFLQNKYASDTFENDNTEAKAKTASEEIQLPLPLPRRNSIDFSKEGTKQDLPKFENQISDFTHRRHTDNTLERRNLAEKLKEYTTQKLRQEWAEHEEMFQIDVISKENMDWYNSTLKDEKSIDVANEQKAVVETAKTTTQVDLTIDNTTEPTAVTSTSATALEIATTVTTTIAEVVPVAVVTVATPTSASSISTLIPEGHAKDTTLTITNTIDSSNNSIKEDSKNKKKRRKKSQMKKKNAQRKSSSSSSLGSSTPADGTSTNQNNDESDPAISTSISNNTNTNQNTSLNDEYAGLHSGEQISPPLISALSEQCSGTSALTPSARIPDLDIHFFSDTEVTSPSSNAAGLNSRNVARPSTPIQSDSELEISMREKETDIDLMTPSASWKWGELPTTESSEGKKEGMLSSMFNFMRKTNKIRKQGADGGIYLSDLDAQGMDPEMAALYFPNVSIKNNAITDNATTAIDDDGESGNGTSLPHSPSSMEGQKSIDSDYEDGKAQDAKYLDFVAMSLCGLPPKGDPADEDFNRNLIKYSDVCENPSLFASPKLVVRLNGKYYSWAAACPIVMTMITFQKPLCNDAIEQLMSKSKEDAALNMTSSSSGLNISADAAKTEVDNAAGQTKRSWWNWRRSQTGVQINSADAKIIKNEDKIYDADVATQTTRPNSPDVSENTLSKTDSTLNAENTSALVENLEDLSTISSKSGDANDKSSKNERYKKSLRLSSKVIKNLNLKEGMNEIEFSVTTAYQGTTRCKCYLFRWKHNDKVVISDIDGTITRSDVLGHILPMVGKDWAQFGVAQLFSKIEQNGYKLLYLSARAIGQSRATREYLRSIRQGNVMLPNGPLLLNPTSLLTAFHREVIERKPELFKIACLSDISDLFPEKNPFYAGYGNRINDVWAYRAVGIPIMRIFTINTKGELKHELTQTFQSSGYISQSLEVDEYFPALEIIDYEYRTDHFDDDEEEDELKFSETESDNSNDNDNDNNDNNDDDDVFSDDYANDGIVINEKQYDNLHITTQWTTTETKNVTLRSKLINEQQCNTKLDIDNVF